MNAKEILTQVQKTRTSPPMPGLGLKLTQGLPKKKLRVQFLRELTPADLIVADHTRLGSVAPELNRIRDSHHLVARLLAEGLREFEVSAVTGYAPSRISILKNDPAFKELLEFYRENVGRNYTDVHSRLSMVALEATAELYHRLTEDPDSVKTAELVEIAKMAHDRTGMGPTSKLQSMNVTLSGAELAELKREVREGQRGTVQRVQAGQGTEISLARGEWSSGDQPSSPAEEGEGEKGHGLREEGGPAPEEDAAKGAD